MKNLTLNEVHEFWKNPNDRNNPLRYLLSGEKSKVLLKQVLKLDKKKEISILELGCNVGRNLDYLYNAGFRKLAGIDINKNAIAIMAEKFPEVYRSSLTRVSSLEKMLIKVKEGGYDLVYSMAVLMHIHPDSESIFKEMARVSNKYIMTIEVECGAQPPRIWIRNYKEIFEGLGFKEKSKMRLYKKTWGKDYVGRVFQKNA